MPAVIFVYTGNGMWIRQWTSCWKRISPWPPRIGYIAASTGCCRTKRNCLSGCYYTRDGASHRGLADRTAGAVREERAYALARAGRADRGDDGGRWLLVSAARVH